MAYEFKLPDLGEGLTEGEVARWLVTEGQEVAEDDPLVEIQTDKATVEIPSPGAGVVSRIFVAEGEVVPVGTVLVSIGGDSSGEPATVEQPVAAATPERARTTPLVRKVAQELGVDIGGVAGTGPQGRITEEDVHRAASGGAASEGRREPLRGVRRVIA
ncbi:MAG: biotin/lipoyl-containing protein, partial [Gaiellaceae bacterium]